MGWETETYDLCQCPCGQGHVVLERHSPDNAWSRPYDTVELACQSCRELWEVNYSGDYLIHRPSDTARREAARLSSQAAGEVVAYLNSLLPNYAMPSFKTMAAEFEYLEEVGLYRGTVGRYRYARRSATMLEMAEIQAESAIVPTLIQTVGDAETYETLLAAAEEARKVATMKADAVQRIKIPNKFQ